MYMPPGFATVTLYLLVESADRFVSFLVAGLGGREMLRTLRPDGKIANAQIAIGTSTLMVSEATPRYPAMPASYYLYVEDAHSAMQTALNAGATLEMAVQDMTYGDRQGGVRDPAGNIWWISQRLVQAPYTA
jgi:PhnB protein